MGEGSLLRNKCQVQHRTRSAGMGWALSLGMALVSLGTLTGCSAVPEWVERTPSSEEYYYGFGSAGQTYTLNRSESLRIARERALVDLASQLRTHVTSSTHLIDRGRSTSYAMESLQISDEELENIGNVDTWFDETGEAGPARHTYVLVRISREDATRILEK